MNTLPHRTRFAPSPTGLLHVGNGYSALVCQRWADQHGSELLLRIEDIDQTRCRPKFTDAIQRDLHWLGIQWQPGIMLQSCRHDHYQAAITQLQQQQLLYPCFCSRTTIHAQIEVSAPHQTQPHYPGICRGLSLKSRAKRMRSEPYAWRLNVAAAATLVGSQLEWVDNNDTTHTIATHTIDDTILVRKDIGISYHLAVVVDDAAQDISMVIRGEDLLASTGIQLLLQRLLNLPHPRYYYHPLVVDNNRKRLAKRDNSTTLHSLAQAGVSPTLLIAFLQDKSEKSLQWSGTLAFQNMANPINRKRDCHPHQ
ncbi:MAG: tRNA glutamyl-Q(34) synthetase GluQRS [Mariprofundales bacterium]